MTSLIRWNPIAELESFTHDPFFRRFLRQHGDPSGAMGWYPAMDLVEEKDALFALLELPGVDPKQVEINVQGDHLTVRGKREAGGNAENRSYLRRELTFGEFERTVQLPYRIEADKAKASYRNGVLSIRMPKASEYVGRQIPVDLG